MVEETIESPELPEFILGTLSTKEGRLKRARIGRIGFYHDSALDPPDPKAGEPVTISVRVGAEIAVELLKQLPSPVGDLFIELDALLDDIADLDLFFDLDIDDPVVRIPPAHLIATATARLASAWPITYRSNWSTICLGVRWFMCGIS